MKLLEINELEKIMEQHTERLIRLAFYYVRDLQCAEDIVQDVFIKFYDHQQTTKNVENCGLIYQN